MLHPMFAFLMFLLANQTVELEGSLAWGYDDRHEETLAYRQSVGQVPVYVEFTDCLSIVGHCDWIGDQVDLFIGHEFKDRLWVCDCAAEQDISWNRERGRVAEVPLSTVWWEPEVGPLDGVRVMHYPVWKPTIPH